MLKTNFVCIEVEIFFFGGGEGELAERSILTNNRNFTPLTLLGLDFTLTINF